MRYLQLLLLGLLSMALVSSGATAGSSQPPELIDAVDVGAGPMGAAVNPEDDRIYVANYHDDTISVIDSVTHEIITTIAVSDGPQSIAVNTSTNRIYVGNGLTPT